MIGKIAKIIVALNSNSRPGEIASAIAFGFWLALIPGENGVWIFIFLIGFFLKHNLAAMVLSMGLLKTTTWLADPLLDWTGVQVLEATPLQGVFTALYNLPLFPFSQFNNTIVMGGFLWGLILWLPHFFLFRFLVNIYRKRWAPRLAQSKFIKAMKKVPLFSKLSNAVAKVVSYT